MSDIDSQCEHLLFTPVGVFPGSSRSEFLPNTQSLTKSFRASIDPARPAWGYQATPPLDAACLPLRPYARRRQRRPPCTRDLRSSTSLTPRKTASDGHISPLPPISSLSNRRTRPAPAPSAGSSNNPARHTLRRPRKPACMIRTAASILRSGIRINLVERARAYQFWTPVSGSNLGFSLPV